MGLILPRKIFTGLGSLENLKDIQGKKVAIITGKGSMIKYGIVDRVQKILKDANIESFVFDGVEPDPSKETVFKGTEIIKKEKPDVILGLGGCSAIDAAKIMWVLYEYPETKFEDIIAPFTIKPLRNKAQFIAIPSTSGTGTEVTCVAVITDREKGVKYPIVSYELTPDIAIVDGELCKTMPPHITANTGLDALAHNTEAYVSTLATYYTDPIAKQSIELIFNALPKAYKNGSDLEARQIMHDASCQAGIAFTNALLGIVHSMAHQVGGMFGVPHGCANAILMPNIIRYNGKSTKKYEDLAKIFGKSTTEEYAVEIEKLRAKVGVVSTLEEAGVSREDFYKKLDTISQNAFNDPCTGANPRETNIEDIKKIFISCFEGKKLEF